MASQPVLPRKSSVPWGTELAELHGASNPNLPEKPNTSLLRPRESRPSDKSSPSSPIVASPSGDVILKYTKPYSGESYYWKVESRMLRENSPYFRVLLDPTNNFIEGQLLAQQLAESSGSGSLPVVVIPATPFTELYGVDSMELFLQILCFESLASEENNDEDEGLETVFTLNLKAQPLSLIARLVEIADYYNSPLPVLDALRRMDYSLGKGKSRLQKFSETTLKMSEDRIRQTIVVADFLKQESIAKIMAHALVIAGSKRWVHSPEVPEGPYFRWHYLANGLEEELYYRRQCVLNTITDLQAYFLRKYGALESNEPMAVPSGAVPHHTITQHRVYQCRAGLGNASQCDLFHLGQMTRFFALRAKSIFIGSTLIDPEFSPPGAEDEHDGKEQPPVGPDLSALIVSLKKHPDYQIDLNHQACGVKRRLLPILDGIEKFLLDGRGMLGLVPSLWDQPENRQRLQWQSDTLFAEEVHIVLNQISYVHIGLQGATAAKSGFHSTRSLSHEDHARALFTAKKRKWEPETF
ncbi:uncharacterized protein N7496_011711 [Penicillium cataractarum]|uniref:BTB domain-containing protein n=1 Tax=Penicillium cataractarum TaxID=2100454 RepID=A0A9W9RFH7_9EURO|nr:uncharacterized protein N7496_011711 [Penicillium cataractarum]KAJ5359298.1 hypothetical protein N7496_011711 [Penicillium cataractarum]